MNKINLFSFGHMFFKPDPPNKDTIQKIWDVRNIIIDPYPNFTESGLDDKVSAYVLAQPGTKRIINTIKSDIERTIIKLQGHEFNHMDIFIGCAGGYQRSVAVTENIFAWLNGKNNKHLSISIGHLSFAKALKFIADREKAQ